MTSPPRPNLKEVERSKAQLDTISRVIAHWLKWQESDRQRENLITDSGTHVMTVPVWPSRGQFAAWIEALIRAQTLIDSLLSERDEARNNALEEAAKVADKRYAQEIHSGVIAARANRHGVAATREACSEVAGQIAQSIRAMRGNAE